MSSIRTRWAALGAAVAITLGAGGIGLASATSPAEAVTFVPITPCRVIDTRPAPDTVGTKSSPLGPGETHTVDTHGDNGDCTGIPSDATAVSLNVTALGATLPTFLTIWATGETQPVASSLNPAPGQPPTPNAVTTNVNTDGEFNIFNLAGNVHVLADVNGYYVDHHHDDRYYTKSAVTQAIDDARAEVHVTDGEGLDDLTMIPESSFDTLEETVTTERSGHLLVSKLLVGSAGCAPDAGAPRYYYITVDGVGLPSSAVSSISNDFQELRLHGVTEDAVESGSHEIGIGVECLGDSTAGGGVTFIQTNASVVVLPAD